MKPNTVEEFADEIVAASQLDMSVDIFRAGVIVALLAWGEKQRSEGFRDGENSMNESYEMMAN